MEVLKESPHHDLLARSFALDLQLPDSLAADSVKRSDLVQELSPRAAPEDVPLPLVDTKLKQSDECSARRSATLGVEFLVDFLERIAAENVREAPLAAVPAAVIRIRVDREALRDVGL